MYGWPTVTYSPLSEQASVTALFRGHEGLEISKDIGQPNKDIGQPIQGHRSAHTRSSVSPYKVIGQPNKDIGQPIQGHRSA